MTAEPHGLRALRTEDGSFSLFSTAVGEGFHSGRGALAEARSKFVAPAALERWGPGARLRVVDVCVGTGCNTAALLEAHGLGRNGSARMMTIYQDLVHAIRGPKHTAALFAEYNDERLHAALGYIEPREVHFGEPDLRRQVRAERLNVARQLRRAKNRAIAA